MAGLPLSLSAYRMATQALAPIAPLVLRRRARRGKECTERLAERLGHASRPRPAGELVWIHGASIGECLSVLPLIDALLRREDRSVLVTSGTVTSARLMAERLPPRTLHQFAPVDTPAAVARFLGHWRPKAGLFVDSEIWPNMVMGAGARGVRLAIINGRMSEKSFAGWKKLAGAASALLARYDLCLAQDDASAARFAALGARGVQMAGNLKSDAPPLPADPERFDALRHATGGRPLLLAASTHPGEEAIILAAHDALKARFADLLTILVPRHPQRGDEVAALCAPRRIARRAQGALPDAACDIYIADTIGELGLFYRLAPFAFLGGSLVPHGGQNPLEAVRLGAGVLAGPYTDNFTFAYGPILAAQGAGRVATAGEIADIAGDLIAAPAARAALRAQAAAAIAPLTGAVERTRLAVETLLNAHARA